MIFLYACFVANGAVTFPYIAVESRACSDAWRNDLPNAIFLGCWLWEKSLSFCEILTPYTVFSKIILRMLPTGNRDRIRPSGGSTRKIIFEKVATCSQDIIALAKPTSKEHSQRKLWTRQTLLPGIIAQLYTEGYRRPTTLAANPRWSIRFC